MSEADKIIESLKNSGRKVEEFYTGNKTSDINVANIEEDVKILEEFAEICKAGLACYDQTREGEALERILAEREQKDKRIQELEEESRKKSIELICYQEELDNSIPEQAVIDKIKEYDKKMEEDAGHPNWVVTDRIVMNVLQELLETK